MRSTRATFMERELGSAHYDAVLAAKRHLRVGYRESPYFPLWQHVVGRMFRAGRVGPVLDLGCGTGQFAALLHDRGVDRYLGVDFSPGRIEHARRLCPSFRFACEDLADTAVLAQPEYEDVVCLEVLEHLTRDLELLARIRSGVRFWGSVPAHDGPGHVRHFASAAQVFQRYARCFRTLSVDTFDLGDRARFFLLWAHK